SYRVERLHDMREWDAVAEGIAAPESEDEISALGAFQELWLSLNGPGSWVSNPFVWVVEFNRRIS
ncbi:MAG TPA: hypothetical protein VEQ17_02765, partial [Steroidobacteraceae bacterium]|nr:hypothetical protein [Steroidobacteraceae bacterium]